jgi:hypothetical protein
MASSQKGHSIVIIAAFLSSCLMPEGSPRAVTPSVSQRIPAAEGAS